jgi:type IX secretion system PorP/SprF family membrane protein
MDKYFKTMRNLLFFCAFIIFMPYSAFSQQDAHFTQFFYNKIYFNPGVTGVEQQTQLAFNWRGQWLGYQPTFDKGGSPNTALVSFQTAIPKFNSGIGSYIVFDQLGPLTNMEAQVAYAYHLKLNDNSKLSFGLRGGIYGKLINNYFRPPDTPASEDDLIPDGTTDSSFQPDMGVGVYYHSDKLFGGISMNHLTSSQFSIAGVKQGRLENSYYVMGGYNWEIHPKWVVTPVVLAKSAQLKQFSFDVGATAIYNERIIGGATFRNQESVNLMLAVNIPKQSNRRRSAGDNNLRLAMSADLVIAGTQAKEPTSLELSVVYLIPIPAPLKAPIIRTPQYRK